MEHPSVLRKRRKEAFFSELGKKTTDSKLVFCLGVRAVSFNFPVSVEKTSVTEFPTNPAAAPPRIPAGACRGAVVAVETRLLIVM
ncbi:hypothetical protein Bca52824_035207 [Brassica carinata]|uniref:Uncharacterized protein n=1 Tax=Brassica carinata TaxID=52824 RepID=A0A8X7S4T8_BRACI|nr:hypothetical protein Bca52824_035207 [Brassica carinata]